MANTQLDMFSEPVKKYDKFVVLDFETGGLDEQECGLASAGMVFLDSDLEETYRCYVVLYEPDKRYEASALRVNGLSLEELKEKGMKPESFIPLFHQLLDDRVKVCHNAQFDLRWLNARGWNIQEAICTMENDYSIAPAYKHKLGIVYNRYYGHDFEGAHNSMSDADATADVLRWQVKMNQKYGIPKQINWDRFSR